MRDFVTYLQLDGIPSRQRIEQARLPFTRFVTDPSDRAKGVWPSVFLNLDDFGRAFARGWQATPNAFGPIALQVHHRALLSATDVAVALRSAGAQDFDRAAESLDSVADLDRVFLYPQRWPPVARMRIRFGDALRQEFGPTCQNATTPEVSVTTDGGLIGLDCVIAIWVDPVQVNGQSLPDVVRNLVRAAGRATPVVPRWIADDRVPVLADLVRVLSEDGPVSLALLRGRADVDSRTREWAERLLNRGLGWQFDRYVNYFREGTLGLLSLPPTAARTVSAIARADHTAGVGPQPWRQRFRTPLRMRSWGRDRRG